MDKKTLGKTDIQISALGFGAWAIGGQWTFDGHPGGWGETDDAESARALEAAFEAGITLIDTAANYGAGHSERMVGKAVKNRRDQVVIATKFGFDVDEEAKRVAFYDTPQLILDNIEFSCERSLRNLDTDYIDLYQFHQPDFPMDRLDELIAKLEALVAQGKVRTYGWSTGDVVLAEKFAELAGHAAAIQHPANVLEPAADMFAFTAKAQLTSLIRSPLLMGFLSDKYNSDTQFIESDIRKRGFPPESIARIVENRLKIREILTDRGRTVAQGALAWLWAQGEQVVPIPGIRTEAQARENAGAVAFGPLSPQQISAIDELLGR